MQIPLNKIKYHHLTTSKQIDKLHKHIKDNVNKFAFDTETTGADKLHRVHVKFTKMFGASIYFPYHAIWIEGLDEDNKFTKRVIAFFKDILEDKKKIKILHNATFDINVLYKHNINMELPIWDTKTMAREYDENDLRGGLAQYRINTKEKGLPLKPLTWKYLGWKYDTLDFDKMDIKEYPLEDRVAYGGNDVIAPYYLADFYYPELKKQNLLYVFNEIEQPNILATAHMNRTGIVIDAPYLIKKAKEVNEDVEKIENEIQKLVGEAFNLRSPAQMRKILYDKLKYPIKGQTKGGESGEKKISTGTPTLKLVQEDLIKKGKDTSLIDKILFYRAVDQINKMYLKPFPKKHLMPDGRIYPAYPQNETVTSRMKSRNPNFQNLKKEMKDPKHPLYKYSFIIKHSVIAPKDFWIVSADYSQLEYRLLAHHSEDKKLIEGYCSGDLDIHILVAADMLDIDYGSVTEDERQEGKTLNFGTVYGQGPYNLSIMLKCTEEKAKEKIDYYFSRFPGVKSFIDKIHRNIIRKGYVVTFTGRRRRIPEVYSSNRWIREAALRQSVNSVIQGGATGDINKMALNDIYFNLVDEKKIFMPADIHDEILLYVHDSIVDEVKEEMTEIMENVCKLKVPLVVKAEKKKHWVEA